VTSVVVVGAGVGGLAAAIRLRAAGHDVVVLERRAEAGGKLGTRVRDGFRFETGPSLLTLPGLFADLAGQVGRDLHHELHLERLDPICRYRFADGSGFDACADPVDAEREVERFSPGQGQAWTAFHDRARRVWEVAERTFLAGPMESPTRLLGRMRSPADLLAIDGVTTLARRAERTFTDPRLVQWAGRYATYSGSSARQAPATLACIAAIEADQGAWYPAGGLGALRDLIVDLAVGAGVVLRCDTEVEAVTRVGDRVTGVRLADGSHLEAPIVVANADAVHLYRDLLPHPRALRRAERAPRSSSGFVLLAGVEGSTEGLAHHNVAFSGDPDRETTELFERRVPLTDPTVYLCNASVTDPTAAPVDCESWFVLVNAPAGAGDMAGYEDHILEVMARRGWDLAGRTRFVERITPADIESRFRTWQGAIYGTSSNGRRAAFLRPGNRGPLRGLYLVGGSAHPGGGLPLVAISGRIVADAVGADLARERAPGCGRRAR
jgi:phytoene desaturase